MFPWWAWSDVCVKGTRCACTGGMPGVEGVFSSWVTVLGDVFARGSQQESNRRVSLWGKGRVIGGGRLQSIPPQGDALWPLASF